MQLSDRSLLEGINISVWVGDLKPEIEKLGLTKQALQTDVELQFRKYGIRVFKVEHVYGSHLSINVIAVPQESGFVVYSFLVQFIDLVIPVRNPRIALSAPVWQTGVAGTVGIENIRQIREEVKDYVNKFINDYLAANPKEQPVKEEDKKPMNK